MIILNRKKTDFNVLLYRQYPTHGISHRVYPQSDTRVSAS